MGQREEHLVTKLFRAAGLAAIAVAVVLLVPVTAGADPTTIKMKDDCDPATFNLAVPATPPTCVGSGGTTFNDFIGQLVDHKFAGAWRFSPSRLKIDAGSSLRLVNQGGETHTLTQVTQFGGGGIVPPLNQILFGTPTPPTFFFGPPNFVPAGGTSTIGPDILTPGTHLLICIIHPWMEETIVVENGD
jgi:plastocyanin